MKWGYFTLLLIGISLLEFCTTEVAIKNESTEADHIAIDSTNFYDSLYAPLRCSLDSIFYNKFIKRQFNGSILFAKNGRIIINKAYGYSDLKSKDTLSVDHTFHIKLPRMLRKSALWTPNGGPWPTKRSPRAPKWRPKPPKVDHCIEKSAQGLRH